MSSNAKYGICRCGAARREDGACPHKCPPAGQQKRRRRAEGVRARPDSLLTRRQVNEAAARVGIGIDQWGALTPQGAQKNRSRAKAGR